MAIFHYSAQVISRGAGRSVVAAAAYRAATAIHDERTGLTHDYGAKEGVAFSEILAPQGSPDWVHDRQALWNAVEAAEKRVDAQTAREVNVALPKELSQPQQIALLRAFIEEQYVSRGMVADVALHADDPNNPHAHILLTMRHLGPEGFGAKNRDWNHKDMLVAQREAWARHANLALHRAGHQVSIDHRSLVEQGIERTPTIHLGPAVTEMEARGLATQKGEAYRNIVSLNEYRAKKEAQKALGDRAIEYVSRQHSTFTERDITRYLAKRAGVHLGPEELKALTRRVLSDPRVVSVGRGQGGETRYSTAAMQAIEAALLDRAKAMHHQNKHGTRDRAISEALARHVLSSEQDNALRHITRAHQIAVVEGMAGTGKTRMLRAAREVWESSGYEVRGAALAGKAADGLEQDAGIRSQTVYSLLCQLDEGKTTLNRGTVLVVDEAGMVGSEHMNRLTAHVERAGAKVVLVGDSRQLQPIDAGGAFRLLSTELGHAELSDIRRQHEAWQRQSVHEMSRGQADLVIRAHYARGLANLTETKTDAIEAVHRDWAKDRQEAPDKSQIILAGTRAEVRALNDTIRTRLQDQGELLYNVRVRTDAGVRDFAAGDRIILLKNQTIGDLRVKNGNLGRVSHLHVSPQGTKLGVALDNGHHVVIDPKEYPNFDHGYAMTVHKAQGVTVDRAYVLVGAMHDRELSYVSMSRAREPTRLYIDRQNRSIETTLARTAERMSTSHQKDTSQDYRVRPAPLAPKRR